MHIFDIINSIIDSSNSFLPRDALCSANRGLAIACCPSVRLSVCLSQTVCDVGVGGL